MLKIKSHKDLKTLSKEREREREREMTSSANAVSERKKPLRKKILQLYFGQKVKRKKSAEPRVPQYIASQL